MWFRPSFDLVVNYPCARKTAVLLSSLLPVTTWPPWAQHGHHRPPRRIASHITSPLFVSLWQITNTEYFAPLLAVNQHASHTVLEEIPSVNTFASLSNWLMRPVPTVTTAVRRFRERYFEDNYVIGEGATRMPTLCQPVPSWFYSGLDHFPQRYFANFQTVPGGA